MRDFATKALLGAVIFSGAVKISLQMVGHGSRHPSSVEDSYELTVQSIALDANSRLAGLENVFIRASFAQNQKLDFGKGEHWKIARGETKALALRLDIQRPWILGDDSMEFRMEIVQDGVFETVLVRCAQISREVSQYNRSYQCSIPGENTPVLAYRLAKKGAPPLSVAQAQ